MKKEKTELKFVRALCYNIINIWKKAWLYRVNTVIDQKEDTSQDSQQQQYINKLKFIYKHQKYLHQDNTIFLKSSYNEHIRSSHLQIKTWIKIHYKSMHQQILLNSQKERSNRDHLSKDLYGPVRGSLQESRQLCLDFEVT